MPYDNIVAVFSCLVLFVGVVLSALGLWLRQSNGFALLLHANNVCRAEVQSAPGRPAFYPTTFGWCQLLRERYKLIKNEFLTTHSPAPTFGELMPEQKVLSEWGSGGKWRVVVLRLYNRDTNVSGFPETRKLLERVPGCTTAMFSILEPGRELVTHCGPNFGVLRYHLALIVPRKPEECTLMVAGQERHWIEGGDLLFDDTHPHSALNASSEPRVVLFLDVLRPLQIKLRAHLNVLFQRVIAPQTSQIREVVARVNEEHKGIPLFPIH